MSVIPLRRSSEEEPGLDSHLRSDMKTRSSENVSWSEARLIVVEIMLKKMRERGDTMRNIVTSELPRGSCGPSLIENMNERQEDGGASGEVKEDSGSFIAGPIGLTDDLNTPLKMPPPNEPDTREHHSEKSVLNISSLSPTSEMISSPSMSLLDESAQHMFALMKGLHANQPPAEVRSYDPERVNSAVSCANTIYKIMRLKLDAIKIQEKMKADAKA
jgi:hypothetical protein